MGQEARKRASAVATDDEHRPRARAIDRPRALESPSARPRTPLSGARPRVVLVCASHLVRMRLARLVLNVDCEVAVVGSNAELASLPGAAPVVALVHLGRHGCKTLVEGLLARWPGMVVVGLRDGGALRHGEAAADLERHAPQAKIWAYDAPFGELAESLRQLVSG